MRLLVALLAPLVLVGCLHGGDPTTADDTSTVTPTPSPNWLETLLASPSQGVSTQPTLVLSQSEIDELLGTLVVPPSAAASIATSLMSVDASWSVAEADIIQFADEICFQGPNVAAAHLFARIPGAAMEALPPLNEAIALVPERCVITNPAAIDNAANAVLSVLTANQQSRPPEPVAAAEPTDSGMTALYAATCAGIDVGVAAWAKQRLNAGGTGGVLLSMVLAAGMTQCSDALAGIFDQL